MENNNAYSRQPRYSRDVCGLMRRINALEAIGRRQSINALGLDSGILYCSCSETGQKGNIARNKTDNTTPETTLDLSATFSIHANDLITDICILGGKMYVAGVSNEANIIKRFTLAGVYDGVTIITFFSGTTRDLDRVTSLDTDGTYLYVGTHIVSDNGFVIKYDADGAQVGAAHQVTDATVSGNTFVRVYGSNLFVCYFIPVTVVYAINVFSMPLDLSSQTTIYTSGVLEVVGTVSGISVDASYVYIVSNNWIRKIDSTSGTIISTTVYSGQAPAYPRLASGYIYVSDATGERILKIDVSTMAVSDVIRQGMRIETEWNAYFAAGASESLGTPDAGVSIPALEALTQENTASLISEQILYDMRGAIESIAVEYENTTSSNAFNWTDASSDNLYYVAMGDRTDYGATGGAKYDWTRQSIFNNSFAFVAGDGLYQCILDHTSGSLTEPGSGANWQTHWKWSGALANSFDNWQSGRFYCRQTTFDIDIGELYECIVTLEGSDLY